MYVEKEEEEEMEGRREGGRGGAYLSEPNGSALPCSLPRPFIASAMLLPEAVDSMEAETVALDLAAQALLRLNQDYLTVAPHTYDTVLLQSDLPMELGHIFKSR